MSINIKRDISSFCSSALRQNNCCETSELSWENLFIRYDTYTEFVF